MTDENKKKTIDTDKKEQPSAAKKTAARKTDDGKPSPFKTGAAEKARTDTNRPAAKTDAAPQAVPSKTTEKAEPSRKNGRKTAVSKMSKL